MGRRQYPHGTIRLTTKEWEDLIIVTALLLGYEDNGWPVGEYWQKDRWRRASKWLWVEKGMHVRYDGTIFVREGMHDDGQFESNLHKSPSASAMFT